MNDQRPRTHPIAQMAAGAASVIMLGTVRHDLSLKS